VASPEADDVGEGRQLEVDVAGEKRRVFCREIGPQQAPALVFLHGGWGYGAYPLPDAARAALARRFRLLIPDRTGYGRSQRREELGAGFHADAARETLALLDALGCERALLWGHSDGAVTAAIAAILAPERIPRLVIEATHLDRRKPASRGFFEAMVEAPDSFGRGLARALEADHGPGWRDVLAMEGRAWLDILDTWEDPGRDLFGGRLSELEAPVLVLHGERDPRTEPGELEALVRLLPRATLHLEPGAGHSPHSEAAAARRVCAAARRFLTAFG